MRLGAVVPAAGLSRRMGAEKILLPFRGSTMLESVLAALADLQVETAVVLRPGLEEAVRLASRAGACVVWNREPEAEMLVSIRLGVEALSSSLDAFFVWPADHPAVRPATLRLLAAGAAPERVLIPSYRSRRGHPALVGGNLKEELLRIPMGEGLRWLWRDRAELVRELPVEDPGVVANLDTPDAYERALEAEQGGHPEDDVTRKRLDGDTLEPMRRFAKPFKDGTREPDPFLCRHLRTKTWYAPDSYPDRDVSRSSSTAQYWCLKTMRPDGPDGALALPEDCIDERVCFEPAAATASES